MNPVPAVTIEAELLVIGYGNTLRGLEGRQERSSGLMR
jgi:hypothetical protein